MENRLTELQRQLHNFRRRLMLRTLGYAALCGLVVALLLVVGAPWLRGYWGEYAFWITLALPVALPGAWVLLAWFSRPDRRTTVLAADQWCRAGGSVVAAWELEQANPDSAFAGAVAARGIKALQSRHMPEPRLLRRLLVLMLVLVALVPLSRIVHAELQEDKAEELERERAAKTDVKPESAAEVAEDAGRAAEQAKEIGARQQERLADDIEQLARNTQAGPVDKERALREANSLADRAKNQQEAQDGRANAREALGENPFTRELAEALENADSQATREALDKVAKQLKDESGKIDAAAADELRKAVEQAAARAPLDPALRRAAEKLSGMLDKQALEERARKEAQAKRSMTEQGMDPAAIEKALEAIRGMDEAALRKAMEEFAQAASPLRDIDPRAAEDLLKQLDMGKLSPEDAQKLAQAARELSERLQVDAETLREMLRKGREFEGLEGAAREAMKRAQAEGNQPGEGSVPDWARREATDEMKKAWRESQGEGGQPSSGGSGQGKGEGSSTTKGNPTRELEGGVEAGVETTDTGRGKRDPDAEENELDPTKAGDETANRNETGREGASKGVNTRDDQSHLPRRFREAARKYFER
jgi:hypothetical protein